MAQCLPQELVDAKTPKNSRPAGCTALHMIASGADHEDARQAVMRVLLQRRADVNSTAGNAANTPLMKAAATGAINLVRMLIEAGAHVNTMNERGQTAMDMANRSNKATVRVLEAAGARPSRGWRREGPQTRPRRAGPWDRWDEWRQAGWRSG